MTSVPVDTSSPLAADALTLPNEPTPCAIWCAMPDAHTGHECATRMYGNVDGLPAVWTTRHPESPRIIVDVPGFEPMTIGQARTLISALRAAVSAAEFDA